MFGIVGDLQCKQNFDQLVEITTNMFHIINGSRDIGVSLQEVFQGQLNDQSACHDLVTADYM